jgi:hypothetical protein
MEIADVTDKHLRQEFEQGLKLLLRRILKLNSLPKHNANILAYFENGKLRYRVNLQKAI